jgi:hypothetical protein
MLGLLALLWGVYLSDCFVRQRPGLWTFRAGLLRPVRGFPEADLKLFGESLAFAWTPLIPWQRAFAFSGGNRSGDSLSVRAAQRRLDAVRLHTRSLQVTSGLLFIWVMLVLTLLVVSGWLLPVFIPWAAVAVGLCIATFVMFLRAYRRTYDRRPPLELWLTLALSPVALMRAPFAVLFSAASDIHPFAAAGALCQDDEFLRIARLWHFDNPELRAEIEQTARIRDLHPRLTAGPEDCEAGVTHFCPRCHGTYRNGAGICADCGDVELKGLPAAKAVAAIAMGHHAGNHR